MSKIFSRINGFMVNRVYRKIQLYYFSSFLQSFLAGIILPIKEVL